MFDEKDVILETKHVTRRFPAPGGRTLTACNDVSLKFYRGRTLGLIGESGCGKSTFMRFLVRLDVPTEGEILFKGKDLTRLKGEELRQTRQYIQMVFQDPGGSFNPKMKIRDIICEPLLNFGRIKGGEKDTVARKYLEAVELPGEFADRFPHNMSGGQRFYGGRHYRCSERYRQALRSRKEGGNVRGEKSAGQYHCWRCAVSCGRGDGTHGCAAACAAEHSDCCLFDSGRQGTDDSPQKHQKGPGL